MALKSVEKVMRQRVGASVEGVMVLDGYRPGVSWIGLYKGRSAQLAGPALLQEPPPTDSIVEEYEL